jgi:hypothetical protein
MPAGLGNNPGGRMKPRLDPDAPAPGKACARQPGPRELANRAALPPARPGPGCDRGFSGR